MSDFFRAAGLVKTYRDASRRIEVLKGADLEMSQGEFLVVLGKSGVGKSTLLHILGALDTPDDGEVIFKGESLGSYSSLRRSALRNRHFGFVFQFYHLLAELTALENVMLPGLIAAGRGITRRMLREKAFSIMSGLGVSERAAHRPAKLSGGERQRVAIARALVNEPEILFCDEPTGNLDPETSRQVQGVLWKVGRSRNQTMVIVTHDASMAREADRVVRIEGGKIVPGDA